MAGSSSSYQYEPCLEITLSYFVDFAVYLFMREIAFISYSRIRVGGDARYFIVRIFITRFSDFFGILLVINPIIHRMIDCTIRKESQAASLIIVIAILPFAYSSKARSMAAPKVRKSPEINILSEMIGG